MRIEAIIGILLKLGVYEKFVANWERYNRRGMQFNYLDMSVRNFVVNFSMPSVSFNWACSKEGFSYWSSVDYYLVYRYMDKETRLVKQAILLLQKEGWRINKESEAYRDLKRHSTRLGMEQTIVAYGVKRLRKTDIVDDKLYISRIMSLLKEQIYKM